MTFGKLFSTLFDAKYAYMMIAGALFVVAYTFIGGFLAESASDFMQGVIMIFALVAVLAVGISAAGGLSAVIENAKAIPGFFDFFGIASPELVDGVQQVAADGKPLFRSRQIRLAYDHFHVVLGARIFRHAQVLLKFMSIKRPPI